MGLGHGQRTKARSLPGPLSLVQSRTEEGVPVSNLSYHTDWWSDLGQVFASPASASPSDKRRGWLICPLSAASPLSEEQRGSGTTSESDRSAQQVGERAGERAIQSFRLLRY